MSRLIYGITFSALEPDHVVLIGPRAVRLEPTHTEVLRQHDVARPEFRQLDIFLTVVEMRSFAAASRVLGVTQPAVSQAIRRLENVYGGDLFERRRGAPLALTPIGEAILPSARTILYTLDQQMVRAAETAQSRAGTVTLGFFTGLSAGPLRAGVSGFVAASPDVTLQMVEGLPSELHRQLNERTVDLVVAAFLPEPASKTLEQEQLWTERLMVALPAAHVLARRPELSWEEIASMPVMLRASPGEMIAFRSLLPRFGDRIIDCDQHAVSRDALLDMVGIGMGAAIVFESGLVPHQDVVFREIDGENNSVPIYGLWSKTDGNPLRHRLLVNLRQRGAEASDRLFSAPSPPTAPSRDRG